MKKNDNTLQLFVIVSDYFIKQTWPFLSLFYGIGIGNLKYKRNCMPKTYYATLDSEHNRHPIVAKLFVIRSKMNRKSRKETVKKEENI